jgi:transketolase C-terminal domain/subunit
MTEEELLTVIVEAAEMFYWRVHHDRRSDLARQQGNAGFPDVVLARRGVVRFLELKSDRGQLSTEQFAWSRDLPALEVVRPADLDDVIESLR